MHEDWDPTHLSLVACHIFHLLALFHAEIDNAKNETKIRKTLLSMQEEHLVCRI